MMTAIQNAARPRSRHRIHANPFSVPKPDPMPNWDEAFGRKAPIALEIGFGIGGFLLDLGEKHPEWNVLGVEIRQHFVNGVLKQAGLRNIHNLRAIVANINRDLDELLEDQSVAFVSVNFPDPWFKKRHHKRRVIQSSFLDVLARKLVPGGEFHLMTDFTPIGEDALEIFEGRPEFENLEGPGKFAKSSTTGIMSEREVTHMGRGDLISRLHYIHVPVAS
jgi:tRNA (guanine-N7-)-methyltransferase